MSVTFFRDFSGGLNNRFRSNRITDNQLSACRNARWTRFGALSKRLGTARNVVQLAGPVNIGIVQSLFSYQFSSMANEQLLIGDDEGRIVRTTSIGTYTAQVTGLSTANVFEPNFAALGNKVYFTNGADAVRSIDGSNVNATPSGPPRSRFITVHKGYLFFFNDAVTPNSSRLQWSNRRDGDTYTSTDFEDIYPNDGAYGTGMISMGDELVLFKGPNFSNQSFNNSSMYVVLGDIFDASNPTYSIVRLPLPTGVGLAHGRTARILNGILIFATNDGFYAYEGGLRAPYKISDIIQGEIDNWEKLDIHVSTRRAAATVWDNRYICSLYNDADSTDLFDNRIYVYEDGKWWVDILSNGADDFKAGSSTGMDWSSFRGDLYSGSAFTNVLRRWNTSAAFSDTKDAGLSESVNFSALTKEFEFDEEQVFDYCFVHMRRQSSGTLTFEYNLDQTGSVSNSVDMTAPDTGTTETSSSNILRKKINIGRRGRTIQFRMFNRTANDLEIYAIELHHKKSQIR